MVFSSVPAFLDPPNWNQQRDYQHETGAEIHHNPPAELLQRSNDNGSGSARPDSMTDRARLAKLPHPEPGLKCPRCDSTNTKFCYFNNYSLLQPRHFCKTCRRYWTRGGALRNVPVGGGCRRNRRSKSGGGSKAAADRQTVSVPSATSPAGLSQISPDISTQRHQLPLFSPLRHPLLDYGAAGANLGLAFTGIQSLEGIDFQIGSTSSVPLEQWKFQQFPPPATPPAIGLFPFHGEGGAGCFTGQLHGKASSSSGLLSHLSSVKVGENPRAINLPRQYLTIPGDDQYWNIAGGSAGGVSGGGGWTELPDFNSSAGHIL